eukprot:Pompholyxophrys_punicea_v1_NODE_376_length_2093_cov_35.121153.p2 type:complete len:128 gc:universal NODE_376_length_2093_cov_35.121153:389-772(+)
MQSNVCSILQNHCRLTNQSSWNHRSRSRFLNQHLLQYSLQCPLHHLDGQLFLEICRSANQFHCQRDFRQILNHWQLLQKNFQHLHFQQYFLAIFSFDDAHEFHRVVVRQHVSQLQNTLVAQKILAAV